MSINAPEAKAKNGAANLAAEFTVVEVEASTPVQPVDSSTTVTPPVSPGSTPVIARPGFTVANQARTAWRKTKDLSAAAYCRTLRFAQVAERHLMSRLGVAALLIMLITVSVISMIKVSQLRQLRAELAANQAELISAQEKLVAVKASAETNLAWARDERARPWWSKLGTWW